MAQLLELFESRFSEDYRYNKIVGKFRNDYKTPIAKGTLLMCLEIHPYEISFKYSDDKILRVLVNTKSYKWTDSVYPNFDKVFWVDSIEQDSITIYFLEIGNGRIINDILEIGYDESVVTNYCRKPEDRRKAITYVPKRLHDNLVFDAGWIQFIFVQTYNNKEDSSSQIRITGFDSSVYINVKDGKAVINKEFRNIFPNRYNYLKNVSVLVYKKIQFKDESEIGVNIGLLNQKFKSGQDLLSLWSKYDEFERQEANKFNGEFGSINFHYLGNHVSSDDDIAVVELKVDDSLSSKIIDNIDKIKEKSFEICRNSKGTEIPKKHRKRFIIQDIKESDKGLLAYISDPYHDIYNNGMFVLSSVGEDMVSERRQRIRKIFSKSKDLNPLLFNLKMAMEGLVEGMIPIKREKIKGVSQSLKDFLSKEPYNIKHLTEQQEKAIEMAINTPDIAIIQGPPGTGKSTIMAAICFRLAEIAEKEKQKNEDGLYSKTFLLSAFQNDTVEHIASKVRINGLPTIKVGRETHGKTSEREYADTLVDIISEQLASLKSKYDVRRASVKLSKIRNEFENNKDTTYVIDKISELIQIFPINEELRKEWRVINPDIKRDVSASSEKERLIKAFKGLRTDEITYEDDGYENIYYLLKLNPPLTEEEKDLLKNAPLGIDEVESGFFVKLEMLKQKYLDILYTSDDVIDGGIDNNLIDWIENTISYYKEKERFIYEDKETFLTAVLENISESIPGNEKYIREGIKEYSESIAATNQYSANKEVKQIGQFSNVLLEEAARSNPLDLLIPAINANDRIIMVGDHNQLPQLLEPIVEGLTISSYEDENVKSEMKEKLKLSLFNILYNNLDDSFKHNPQLPRRAIMLKEQYRMHPVIGDFISRMYYNPDNTEKGNLSSKYVDPESKAHGLSVPWAKNRVCVSWDVPKEHGLEKYGKGKSRKAEVIEVIKIIKDIWSDPKSANLSLGVITFYKEQKNLINKAAQKEGWVTVNSKGEYVTAQAYKEIEHNHKEKFRIGTVDGFQGKEFDIVIVSTVRCNDVMYQLKDSKGRDLPEEKRSRGAYGFLTLPNRLNVAFSRAQRLLITVGCQEMFTDKYAEKYVKGLYEFFTKMT